MYSTSRKLQTSAQTRLTAKTIYAAPANRTRRTTAQTYLQSLKTLGSTVERARCHIILATLQSRKQSILSQRGVLEFVLGHFFINLLQKFEIVASVVIAVNECIRFFPCHTGNIDNLNIFRCFCIILRCSRAAGRQGENGCRRCDHGYNTLIDEAVRHLFPLPLGITIQLMRSMLSEE